MSSAQWQSSYRKLAVGLVALSVMISARAVAQRYEPTANPDSPEGQFLELISLQSDTAKKLALIEQFTQRYPKHPAVSWAYEQLQTTALEAGQWDKALIFGEKLVQVNPDDIDAAQLNVKA